MKFASNSYAFPIVITPNYHGFAYDSNRTPINYLTQYCNAFDSVFPQIENNMICTVIPTILPHFSYIGFHI